MVHLTNRVREEYCSSTFFFFFLSSPPPSFFSWRMKRTQERKILSLSRSLSTRRYIDEREFKRRRRKKERRREKETDRRVHRENITPHPSFLRRQQIIRTNCGLHSSSSKWKKNWTTRKIIITNVRLQSDYDIVFIHYIDPKQISYSTDLLKETINVATISFLIHRQERVIINCQLTIVFSYLLSRRFTNSHNDVSLTND